MVDTGSVCEDDDGFIFRVYTEDIKDPRIRLAVRKGYTIRKSSDNSLEYLFHHDPEEWKPYPPQSPGPKGLANVGYNIELRDIFAAHAMEHSIAHMWNMIAMEMQKTGFEPSQERIKVLLDHSAKNSYLAADALIAARENVNK